MTQAEQPLYPKLSSIYNKLMQLTIAIALIIVVMNLWMFSNNNMSKKIDQHFVISGKQYVKQLVPSLLNGYSLNDKSAKALIEQLNQQSWIKDISVYDKTGQLVHATEGAQSIQSLFGIKDYQEHRAEAFVPFIEEIRSDKLVGYVRMTLQKSHFVDDLQKANNEHYDLIRLMLLLAGVIGFLLTRGLNRFSRRGYRLAPETNKAK